MGLGNIGRKLALKAIGLGMSVVANDPYADLDELLKISDYVSLHVFGVADNAALINAEKLALMKPTACLLNLSRGEVIDLDAVAAALEGDRLGGVALDAYVSEPPDATHPIFRHPRLVCTPHSGADTKEAVENVGLMVIEDIQTIIDGKIPRRCLNVADL